MEDIKEITLEKLVESVVTAQGSIEELEAQVKIVKDELQDRLKAMKITGTKVNQWYVTRAKRYSFPEVKMDQAEELGATKKSIDQMKLKALYQKGIKLPVTVTEYILIRESNENE